MKTNLRKQRSKSLKKMTGIALSLAVAAAVAIASTGCGGSAHSSSAPADVTETNPADQTSSGAFPVAVPADSTAQSSTAAAETATTGEAAASASTADSNAAAGQTGTGSTAAQTAAADTTAADSASPDAADAAENREIYDVPSAEQDNADAGSTSAASVIEGVPARDTADTALKESVLSEALVDCTGWGQSAGSSLRAASAATRLLRWANQAQTGSADPTALRDAAAAELGRLSAGQRTSIKENWSFISYDADTILDDIEELQNVLEDAGCLEAAKDAAAEENARSNWKAASEAIEAALRQ